MPFLENIVSCLSERQTEPSGAMCERNTMSHCGRGGDTDRAHQEFSQRKEAICF